MKSTPSLKTLQAQIGGMDCGNCAKTIEASLRQLPGVSEVSTNFATGRLNVSYNPQEVSNNTINERVVALGYTIEQASTKSLQAQIGGMDCGNCAKTIEASLQQMPGVESVLANFATGRLNVSYDPQQINKPAIYDRIKALGYTIDETPSVNTSSTSSADDSLSREQNQTSSKTKQIQGNDLTDWKFWFRSRRGQSVILAGVGLGLGLLTQHLGLSVWLARAFYGIGIVIAGYPVARAGLFELRSRRADMNLLMTISVTGAIILGDWFEGALVTFLFSLGTTLQSFSFGRTRNAIRALMDLTPQEATVIRDGKEVSVGVEDIEVGEVLTIRPGQRVALDGIVVSGNSAIDQSPITGESIPEDKVIGDQVYGGTLNQAGFLEVKVTRKSSDTTVSRIINLVEEAQGSRAPTQQWVDKFATIYTPIVILTAIIIALVPPLAFAQPFNVWVYRALVMLVIACPCALVISTPVSIVSAIGSATRHGVLFKGGSALETAGRLNILAFDKTGTLTQGKPVVKKMYGLGETSSRLVFQIAASLEQKSEHPLAKAIVSEAREMGIELQTPENFTAIPGKGIWANLGDQTYFVGNRRLFIDQGIPLSKEANLLLTDIEFQGQTPVLIGTNKGLLGAVTLADGLRLEVNEAVRLLQKVGLKRLIMLTGDRNAVAKQIAQEVGMSEYQAEMLPEDKLTSIQQLRHSGVVGMVGDGINDAPALASADISFAVGGIDIALETADVVLVGSDLRKLAYAVDLSRRTVSIIQQNVVISLITKGVFLILGTFGIVGLVIAVLADMGTSLFVTANGMRLFKSGSYKF
ncbi:cation-transporting ATPase (plasmid) [Calothrix sp. NIES-4071]|nr:cation-transporting ATPase [Calothrix sp. NIES-4071]BAZ64457.1 cation-transporting ATPase [Calothrix sp. NIES-4105]